MLKTGCWGNRAQAAGKGKKLAAGAKRAQAAGKGKKLAAGSKLLKHSKHFFNEEHAAKCTSFVL
jgi:hypothetical protein